MFTQMERKKKLKGSSHVAGCNGRERPPKKKEKKKRQGLRLRRLYRLLTGGAADAADAADAAADGTMICRDISSYRILGPM